MAKLNVNAGDRVLYQYTPSRGVVIETVAIVTSVKDGKIRIDKNWRTYDEYGNEAEDKDYCSKISVLTKEDEERVKQRKVIQQAYELLQNEITYEQALRIIEILS